jgi:hypothetical protein
MTIAARVAAKLKGPDIRVQMIRGKLGELRVTVDGRDAYIGNQLSYPRPGTVLAVVHAWLADHAKL